MEIKVAVSQKPPVLLDLNATVERAVKTIDEAASQGAKLIVFPEAYLPGYPTWIWRLRPGGDMTIGNKIHTELLQNAVDIAAGGLDPLCEAAAQRKIVVVTGLHEVNSAFSGSTLFNTVVVIGADGTILNRHRKMMPTNPERMVWGFGDASGLRVVDTPSGSIGCLICWESYMPLARFALYAPKPRHLHRADFGIVEKPGLPALQITLPVRVVAGCLLPLRRSPAPTFRTASPIGISCLLLMNG